MELLNDKKVDVDLIKVTLEDYFEEHIKIAKEYKPLMIHYFGYTERATMPNYKEIDFKAINQRIKELQSPVVGVHAYIEKLDFESRDPSYDEALSRSVEVLSYFKENLDVPLLIENYPYSAYYDSLDNHFITGEPKLFHDLCNQLDVGLLLDLSHARVCADYKGLSLIEYLSEFPLERVVEIHVNATRQDEKRGLLDIHLELTEQDYSDIEWVLNQCDVKYLTLEYGGIGKIKEAGRSDKDAIERQLKRLSRMIRVDGK